nr:hypothetical protein [uncultured Roseateles sp.]
MSKLAPPSAITLFCDDVRQEIGFKASAMGIYAGHMYITAPALALTKLVALTFLNLPKTVLSESIHVTVLNHDSHLMPPFPLELTKQAPPTEGDRVRLTIPIEMLGFEAKDGMAVQVRIDGESFHLASEVLRVEFRPGPMPALSH